MNSYCLKCKSKTLNRNENVVMTKNNKYRISSICSKCGTKKSQMISQKEGEGILGKLLFPKKGAIPGLSKIPLIGPLLF